MTFKLSFKSLKVFEFNLTYLTKFISNDQRFKHFKLDSRTYRLFNQTLFFGVWTIIF